MAKAMPGNTSRTNLSRSRGGGITVLRSPQMAHQRVLFNVQAARQYHIKRK